MDTDKDKDDGIGETERLVADYYLEAAKKGVVLSLQDLELFCKKKRLACSTRMLKSMRYRFKYTAVHSRWSYPAKYMGSSIEKLGVIQVDMAQFFPEYKVVNRQCFYFLLGVESLTGELSCTAFPNKSQVSWEKGVVKMIRHDFRHVCEILTDQDGAITPVSFRERIKKVYDVDWSFLPQRSKAFKAERMIRQVLAAAAATR